MKPKQILRLSVDIGMCLLCLMQAGYHLFRNVTHEQLGAVMFMLFLVHHFLNIGWYKSIFRRRYSAQRVFHVWLNLLLTLAMLGMLVSAMIISMRVFAFLGFRTSFFGRKLHMLSTSWGFVLMSMHVGIHAQNMVTRIQRCLMGRHCPNTIRILFFVVCAWGVKVFIDRAVWQNLFATIDYAFFDFNEQAWCYFVDSLAMMMMWAAVAYYVRKMLTDRKGVACGTL